MASQENVNVLRGPLPGAAPVLNHVPVYQYYLAIPGQGTGGNLLNHDDNRVSDHSNEDTNDSIQQSQPVTSSPQMETQTRESTTTDLSENEQSYTINADHDPVLDDHEFT